MSGFRREIPPESEPEPRVSLAGLDSAFLSLETPSTPMNVVGTLVLDASSPSGSGSIEGVLRRALPIPSVRWWTGWA